MSRHLPPCGLARQTLAGNPAEVCMVIEQCTHNQPPTWNTASGLELCVSEYTISVSDTRCLRILAASNTEQQPGITRLDRVIAASTAHHSHVRGRAPNAAHPCLAYPVHTLVLPNSSPEDADMFRMLQRVDVTYLLRPSNGNSESARLCTPIIRKGAGTDLNQPARCAGGHSCCVLSCVELNKMMLTSGDPALSTSSLPSQQRRPSRRFVRCHTLWVLTYAAIAANTASGVFLWVMTWSAGTSATPSTSTASGSLTPHVRLGRRMPPATRPEHCSPISSLPLALFLAAVRPHVYLTGLIRAGTDVVVG
ncbi:hypothetical protein B0H13DRAFT_2519167 [Mycena leptocephala]|nr:hypothetical protein B0H13DRAFT_2519167 [Mycena leptocephala]